MSTPPSKSLVRAGERGPEQCIGPGDFLGFVPGGPAHQIRNDGTEDLVYLSGGESRAVEVADFPRLRRRIVRYGKGQWDFAVYPMDAEVPLFAKRGGEGGGGAE